MGWLGSKAEEEQGSAEGSQQKPHGTTPFHACVNIIKCVVGAGSFFLPYGFLKGGLWASAVGLVLLGCLCDYINVRIIQCKRKVFPEGNPSYPDLVAATLGTRLGAASYVFVLIQGLGACAVYAVFCGDLLNAVMPEVPVLGFIAIMGFGEIILSWLRSLRYVAFTSILGDISLLLGVTVVFVYGFKDGGFVGPPWDYEVIQITTYPQFFGTAAFLFSVTMYLFPIESSMTEPKKFNMALHIAFVITTILNAIFAVFAFLFFGDNVDPIVIDNLGSGVFINVAKIALVFDLVFTFVVVFVPCRDVVEKSLLERGNLFSHLRRCYCCGGGAGGRAKLLPGGLADDDERVSSYGGTTPIATPTIPARRNHTRDLGAVDSHLFISSGADTEEDSVEKGSSDIEYPVLYKKCIVGEVNNSDHHYHVHPSNNSFGEQEEVHVAYWKRIVVRTLMITGVIGLALAVPNTEHLVGLIVGVSNSMNSFIAPMVVYLKVCYDERKRLAAEKALSASEHDGGYDSDGDAEPSRLQRVWKHIQLGCHWFFHSAIIIFGIVAGVTTTIEAIVTVVDDYT